MSLLAQAMNAFFLIQQIERDFEDMFLSLSFHYVQYSSQAMQTIVLATTQSIICFLQLSF